MRRLWQKLRGRRRRALSIAFIAVLCMTAAAWSFWAGKSSGSATGKVGTLSAPTISSATPGAGTVTLTWRAVTPPASGTVSYYVKRDGAAASSACPSQASPSAATSCTDTGVSVASHKYTVTAVWQSWTATSSASTVQVTMGPATHLLLTPTTKTMGAGGADNLTITAQDANNTTVTTYTGAKSLTFSGASASGSFHPTVTNSGGTPVEFGTAASINFVNGIATVSGASNGAMTLYKAETANVAVSDGALSSASVALTVAPASASSFSVLTPATQTAGSQFAVTLTAKDAYGNTATGYEGPKAIAFSGPSSSPSGEAPKYPATVSFTAGVSAPALVTLYNAASATLTAKEGSSVSGSSGSFNVAAGSASKFTIPTPTTQTAGTAFNVTLTANDAWGNTATSYEGTKTIAFSGPSSSPSGEAPKYPATVSFTAGVSASASVTLYNAANATLTAKEGSVSGSSAGFNVIAGSASKFLLSTPTPTAGTEFTETLTAADTYGNTTSGYTGSHTISFSGPSNAPDNTAPKYPTSSISFSSGVGTAKMTLFDAQTTQLRAKASSPTVEGASASFTVNAGNINTLALATPATQTAGIAFNVTLTAEDEFGNTVTSYTGEKTVTFSKPLSSPSGEAPKYPASVNFTAGTGPASITLYNAASTELRAQTTASSNTVTFTVNAGTATKLAWEGANSEHGSAEGTCLFTCTWREIGRGHEWFARVKVADNYGNAVSNLGGGHTVSWTPAPIGQISPSSLSIPSSGVARTSTLTYTSQGSNSWTTDTLTAHSTGFTDATVLFKK